MNESMIIRQSLFSGMDYWNALNFTTKLPLLSQSGCRTLRFTCALVTLLDLSEGGGGGVL